MRNLAAVLLAAFIGVTAYAADPAEDVRQTEIAFAKAFADRDAAKFFGFIADDATFINANRVSSGKAEVTKIWSKYLDAAQPPFNWAPERVVTNARGDLGLSTGPVKDRKGAIIGFYSSVWQKQSDGTWKVVFDGPGAPAPCPEPAK